MRGLEWDVPSGTSPSVTRPSDPADTLVAEITPSRSLAPRRVRRAARGKRVLRFAVLGAGHGGLAMAGHLAAMGFPVNLWNRTATRVEHIKLRGAIELGGVLSGERRVDLATADIQEAFDLPRDVLRGLVGTTSVY